MAAREVLGYLPGGELVAKLRRSDQIGSALTFSTVSPKGLPHRLQYFLRVSTDIDIILSLFFSLLILETAAEHAKL